MLRVTQVKKLAEKYGIKIRWENNGYLYDSEDFATAGKIHKSAFTNAMMEKP